MTESPAETQPPVLIEEQDGIVVVTFNRPKAMNSLNREVSDTIAELMQSADQDPKIKAIIITSEHPKVFSAGADLQGVSQGQALYAEDGPNAAWGLGGCTSKTPSVPVIAAVEGVALGGGFEVALAADLLIASEKASFGLPEVTVGLFAAAGGAVRLPRQLPRKVAMDMLLTGEPLDSDKAYRLGLVSRLVEPGQTLATAKEVAAKIAANAPLAVRSSKAAALDLVDGVEADEASRWERNASEFDAIQDTHDFTEGATAFKERRAPQWTRK